MNQHQNFKKYFNKINFTFQSVTKMDYNTLNSGKDYLSLNLASAHDLYLVYVIKGSIKFKNAENLINLNKDNYVFIIPNNEIFLEDYTQDIEFYIIKITSINLCKAIQNQHFEVNVLTDHSPTHVIAQYFKLMAAEDNKNSISVQQLLLEALFAKIMQDKDIPLINLPSTESHHEVDSVKHHIYAHYSENVTLDQLSTLTSMNKYYLVHIFKHNTGRSPIDFLIHVRIDEAKSLLTNSTLSIAKIAEMVGFASQSYFSKMFKRQTKYSPSKFRKNYNETVLNK